MRRFFDFIDDDFGFPRIFGTPTFTTKYNFYDPERFELQPRQEYKKELITQKEKELEALDKRKEELKTEIKKLKE